MPLIIFRGIYEGFQHDNFLAVLGVERVRDEGASHKVVVYLPESSGLGKAAAFVLQVGDCRGYVIGRNHICAVEHTGNVLLEEFAKAGADMITVHVESPGCAHLDRVIQRIHGLGIKAGAALNPATPDSVLDYILDSLDMALVMSVNPGFGGQKFIPGVLRKIESIAETAAKRGLNLDIEVDGGVKVTNAAEVISAGATVLVAGTAVITAPDPALAVKQLKGCA